MKTFSISKLTFLTFAFGALIFGVANITAKAGEEVNAEAAKKLGNAVSHPYTVIDAEKLKEMQASEEKIVIIDSRGGKYFDGEVIEGAKQLSAGDTDEAGLEKLGVESKDTKIVFYCTNVNCPASAKAAAKAASLGYTNLYKYPGGIEDWKEKGLPTTKL